jgi:hypothetical protein
MNKDTLLDFLGQYDQDLYNELMNTDDVQGFVNRHVKDLQSFPGYAEIEKGPEKTPKEKVKEAFTSYVDNNPYYVEEKAQLLNLKPDEVNSLLAELAAEQKAAEEYQAQQQLMYDRQKAVNDYQHSYLGMDTANPVNKILNWAADKIISDDTRKAIIEDPNNTARIAANAAVDVGGTAADFMPGVGGIVVGPALRTGRDIAEDKDLADIVVDRGADLGANLVLNEGLKGIPGVRDFGPLRKVEEKLPTNEWVELAERANKNKGALPDMPKFKNLTEAQEWILKQPKAQRDAYQKALDEAVGKKEVREAMSKTQEALDEARKQQNRQTERAKEWAKQNKGKAAVGEAIPQLTTGLEKTGVHMTKEGLSGDDKKISNPKKIKGDYDKALDYIIEQNKRQWAAGFRPNSTDDIVAKAYQKWLLEEN